MLLLLEPSAAQRAALDAELAAQQTPGSCEYHRWLTPQQFASAYANSAADVNAVAGWLRTQGFTVAPLAASRGWIEFSGTAAQVTQTFRAPIHAYSTPTGTRYALRSAISVPAALSPVIHGLASLDGARSAAAITAPQTLTTSPAALAAETDSSRAEAMTPQLAAQSIHFDGMPQGTGESIAIAARSNIQSADIDAFRSTFGLTASRVAVVSERRRSRLHRRPGSGRARRILGRSRRSFRARSCRSRGKHRGHRRHRPFARRHRRPVAGAHAAWLAIPHAKPRSASRTRRFTPLSTGRLPRKALPAIAATGDSGAAACHAAGVDVPVTTGYAVNAPRRDAVEYGHRRRRIQLTRLTQFQLRGLPSTLPILLMPPEAAAAQPTPLRYGNRDLPAAPAARLLPDLTLPTALDSALSHGVAFCYSETGSASGSTSGCSLVRAGGSGAAAAIFAGVSAAIAQQNGPQGNLAPRLYSLRSRTGVFSDVEAGTARLACAAGSQGCDASGTLGYDAATGYDLATGLGVPDASALLKAWPEVGSHLVDCQPDASRPRRPTPPIIRRLRSRLRPPSAGPRGTPTGSVDFFDQTTGSNLNSVPYTLDSTGTASITVAGAMPQGGNSIIAQILRRRHLCRAGLAALTVNIQPSTTTTTVTPATTSPKVGTAFNVTATVAVGTPPAGSVAPTGNVTLTVDGANYATSAADHLRRNHHCHLQRHRELPRQPQPAGDLRRRRNFTTSTSTSVP